MAQKGVPTAKSRFFHSFFYSEKNGVSKKVFLRCLKNYKQSCFDGEKGVCPQWCLSDKKKVFQRCFKSEEKHFPNIKKKVFLSDSDKKGVLTVF